MHSFQSPGEDCYDLGQNAELSEPWRRPGTVHIRVFWLLHVSDWVDSLIVPGGLLLVIFCWNAVLRFIGWSWKKVKQLKLRCDKYFCRVTHTQHRWRWSFVHCMMEPVCTFSFAPLEFCCLHPKTKAPSFLGCKQRKTNLMVFGALFKIQKEANLWSVLNCIFIESNLKGLESMFFLRCFCKVCEWMFVTH
jgi:hypothetical protein